MGLLEGYNVFPSASAIDARETSLTTSPIPRSNGKRGRAMDRRMVLRILGAGAIAPRLRAFAEAAHCQEDLVALAQINAQPPRYRLQFFTPEENELVDQLTELIIPADDHSPGARAAKVSLFADLMLATGDEHAKLHWRSGLRAVNEEAAKSSLPAALAAAAANEAAPKSELEHFFASLKEMTVVGYYTSAIGIHQDLGYRGNSFLTSFKGCTHPEHQT